MKTFKEYLEVIQEMKQSEMPASDILIKKDSQMGMESTNLAGLEEYVSSNKDNFIFKVNKKSDYLKNIMNMYTSISEVLDKKNKIKQYITFIATEKYKEMDKRTLQNIMQQAEKSKEKTEREEENY
jgi:hypothetical protein